MVFIKKVVLQGFKSFAKRTEIVFDKGINVIVGPNGAGKSNISDAICFALGRLSVKSMRAEKSRNLIFMGSKHFKPAKEAFVEVVFDNTDRKFAIDKDEVVVRRIVRSNGQSIYKINGDTRTRTELIEMLAQAGIDPYGYNIILQGQIQSIVRMSSEERRKIIEEVVGISVYEWRKEKALKELEKTEARLKEANTILRERGAYLNNLEKERAQAKRYQELQLLVRRLRASILKKRLDEKQKEVESIVKAIGEKENLKAKKLERQQKAQAEADALAERINEINSRIRKATGVEQGKLREEITNLRAEIEGLRVRKEGLENRKLEVERRISEMRNSLPQLQSEIESLRRESPAVAKKAEELKRKKGELAELEKKRKHLLSIGARIELARERISERERELERARSAAAELVRELEDLHANLKLQTTEQAEKEIERIAKKLESNSARAREIAEEKSKIVSSISVERFNIEQNNEIIARIRELDTCPLCFTKLTEEHVESVVQECSEKIKLSSDEIDKLELRLGKFEEELRALAGESKELESALARAREELERLEKAARVKAQVDENVAKQRSLEQELSRLNSELNKLISEKSDLREVERMYREKLLEIEETSSMTKQDVDTALLYKERELEKMRNLIEASERDLGEIGGRVEELAEQLSDKERELEEKEKREAELNKRFEKLLGERESLQKKIQEINLKVSELRNEVREIEDQINYLKIGKAKLDGERETIEIDFAEYEGVELVKGSARYLEERLKSAQQALQNIGSINMRALEVYEDVKKEYDAIKEKVEVIEKERDEILKVIEEVDRKKLRAFMKAFKAINNFFRENFMKLSAKGEAYLEIEKNSSNSEGKEQGERNDVFSKGVDIVVRVAKGKYLDVNSLSGGEQTLVALALLFAIQEYKPHQFYLFDEIDAALDKRNSERLAAWLNRYMKKGQYIIVTHNDALIIESKVLYGVTMHEGVSKVLSLELGKTRSGKARVQEASAGAKTEASEAQKS
ncbi:chromosome segregation protein SMC [Candidatus Pacearchaeota archaeon]|nr:MAG: chromosome segregation protein SMC [Candidatus Pacearchaeota archaeon]